MALALLIGIVGVPIVLMTVLRINAPLVFLSACLGSVLLQFVGKEAMTMVDLFAPGKTTSLQTVQLALVLIPIVLTMLFMIRSVKGNRVFVNIFPAIAASFLVLFLVKPLLSAGAVQSIESVSFWPTIERLQELIVGLGALICLFFLWLQRPKHEEPGKKHK